MKPISRKVAIKLERNTGEYRIEGGTILYLDTTFNEGMHTPVVGTVVEVPRTLTYVQGDWQTGAWKTSMELEVGDEVIMKMVGVRAALAANRTMEDGDTVIAYVDYHDIVLAKRLIKKIPVYEDIPPIEDNQVISRGAVYNVIMLNGWMLVEPEEERVKTSLIVPDTAKKTSAMYGRVAFVGSPNERYQGEVDGSYQPDTGFDVKTGDRVIFYRKGDLILEQEIYSTFAGKRSFFRMQRNQLLAIINE